MRKKVVFLPYDFDTALGINNEGALVFSYNLEDIDQTQGGADVFNGQESVLWKNVRAAFSKELAAMYRTLRSTGALSYSKVERMFEEHQEKWGEAVFNEDAYFKYLAPLIEDGDGAYLSMLQGSKAEQRKWWLYNRTWTRSTTPGTRSPTSFSSAATRRRMSRSRRMRTCTHP